MKFTSNMFFQSAVLPDSKGAQCDSPALLMHTSTPPKSFWICLNIARISSSLVRSHLIGISWPFSAFSSSRIDWKLINILLIFSLIVWNTCRLDSFFFTWKQFLHRFAGPYITLYAANIKHKPVHYHRGLNYLNTSFLK